MGLDKAAGCKQNASEIHSDASEIYFQCNLNVLEHRPRQEQNAFEKHLDLSSIHLDVSDIH